MRVTLKDIKKRKSIQEDQDKYHIEQETKDSITKDILLGSLKKSLARNSEKKSNEKFKS